MTTERILTYSQIKELWHEHEDFEDFAQSIEQAVLQSPEVQALRRDAERYRWLTKNAYVGEWVTSDGYEYRVDGADREVVDADNVHAAIDAAMEKQAAD